MIATTSKMDRQFPNEVFAVIINCLDDQISLMNTALACKDFAVMSRECLFREVDFKDRYDKFNNKVEYLSQIRKFVALLCNPQTSFLGNLSQKLRYSYMDRQPEEQLNAAIIFIIARLTFLTELRIHCPLPAHFPTIATALGKQLEELWLEKLDLYLPQFELFRSMLLSLTVLKFLSIRGMRCLHTVNGEQTLILPSSLRAASFALINERLTDAIAQGIRRSPAPVLETLFLDNRSNHNALWRALPDARVVLDVGTGISYAFVRGFGSGLTVRQLVITCIQKPSIIPFLARFIPNLPDLVFGICIDFLPADHNDASMLYQDRVTKAAWADLDGVIMQRNGLRLLDRVCFRCTRRTNVLGYSSYEGGPDRTILAQIRSLLPRSESKGLIEVDHDRLLFAAMM